MISMTLKNEINTNDDNEPFRTVIKLRSVGAVHSFHQERVIDTLQWIPSRLVIVRELSNTPSSTINNREEFKLHLHTRVCPACVSDSAKL